MMATLPPTATDVPMLDGALFEFEEEATRQPFAVQSWTSYIRALSDAPSAARYAVFERGVHALPRSYKLWKLYLDDVYESDARGRRVDSPAFARLVALYERALAQLSTMPRLWLDYLHVLREMRVVTARRHVFDRALRALPITQHHRIWTPYLAFAKQIGVPRTAVRVYRRYLMLEPAKRGEFVDYLVSVEHYEEASLQLVKLIEAAEDKESSSDRTPHSMWMQLCDMVSQHPTKVAKSLDVEAILRSGMARFSDEVGRLWCSLATYFVRLGMFESARDVYEEGIRTVVTVRDFSMIFDAYVKFIEAMLTAEMDLAAGGDEEDDDEEEDEVDHQAQVDRLLKVYEDVAERRPLLLNSVLLRQNPHNVREWEKRVELVKSDLQKVIRTYAEAVKTVDPVKSGGRLPTLWIHFAKFYDEHGDLNNARAIFKKAVDVEYRNPQELASVYCEWAELELRHENFDEALEIARGACSIPASRTIRLRKQQSLTAKDNVHLSVKLWTLRLDLEESLGDLDSTRAAYDEVFELKIITPQMVLNFATYLEENKYFEESFRVYERGLALFPKFPHAGDLWQTYLAKFVQRYAGTKMERTRDLYEQAIRAAPAKSVRGFYEKFAEFEEQHGMLRNVMTIYERASDAVPDDDKLAIYDKYIKKAQKFFGVAKVRDVYQRGITKLPDKCVPHLCLKFAQMETKLGEFDRARAIYAHSSQFCDPRQHEKSFWKVWHEFEVSHGSEHTFLEMLRIKRSVVAQYSQVNYVASEVAPQAEETAKIPGMVAASTPAPTVPGDAMAALEAQLDVPSTSDGDETKKRKGETMESETERNVRQKQIVEVANEEEIDLDDEDEDDEEGQAEAPGGDPDIEERELPSTLFGNSVKASE
ncbi:pre-mRNA-splicing factor SYF1-like protein [Phytophthora cinnamomi]|uniref:pre-mRNA-splicing factor SYF1-like protein n=1 Tax=Phytophthora cinnamomi TaxID=4785 RepID=UPI003559A0AF|nr:pre-mRNA-splicing factor SYF1-like protein [Phytophthora cinnamomi]